MDLAFTFGIITDGSPEAVTRLHTILDSIHAQEIPVCQILIIGNAPSFPHPNTHTLPFDESHKPRWITRKKNLITENAIHPNIVYLHDYLTFLPNWYANFQAFGDNFHACMCPIQNPDGSRYRDWSLFYDAASTPARTFAGAGKLQNLLPYTETSLSKLMYFSGAYFIAKKSIMQEFPLDERLSWGEGEDVIWSHQFRKKYAFSINPNSPVRLLGKHKDPLFTEIPSATLEKIKAHVAAHPPADGYGCTNDFDLWHEHGHFGPDVPAAKKSCVPALAGAPA